MYKSLAKQRTNIEWRKANKLKLRNPFQSQLSLRLYVKFLHPSCKQEVHFESLKELLKIHKGKDNRTNIPKHTI